jgi:glycosyltransferase involved in cell wall biosynthesis
MDFGGRIGQPRIRDSLSPHIADCLIQGEPTTVQTTPASSRRRYLVISDNKIDVRAFSGITYHLALQGVEDGLLTGMVNLYPKGIADWRVYGQWCLWRLAGGVRGRCGFRFTEAYADGIWKRNLPALQGSIIINNFQLFGPHFLRSHMKFGITPYFYIDATLDEYFTNYSAFETAIIDQTVMREAVTAEREGYMSCRKIGVMSKRSAAYLHEHYAVPQEKIQVIPPGANIPERLLTTTDSRPRGRRTDKNTLVIGFVGLYPERKGLPGIAEAVRLLRRGGYDVRLHVIGHCPPEIAQWEGIVDFGLIEKGVDIKRFIDIIGNVDLGCMLSQADLSPVALLEFLRMGIPVIATDVGGIPDILDLGAGQLVPPEIAVGELAERLAHLIDEPNELIELQRRAWERRHNASWRRVVRELKDLLQE